MSEPRKIGLFGGTFDPVHLGHVHLADLARRSLELDEVRFIPCQISPHKTGTRPASPAARLEMLKLDEDMEQFTTNTAVTLTNAVSQLQNSQDAITAQEGNVALAQEVYDTTNQLYKEGLSPLTDLLEAEVQLREAKTNLNNEVLKFKIAQLNYLQATGELQSLTK